MPAAPILVVGGTGMLRPAVRTLLDRGRDVVLVARRPARAGDHPRLRPVAADWGRPEELGAAVATALDGDRATAGLLWIHGGHEAVHDALAPLLAPAAPVVCLWGSASAHPRDVAVRPAAWDPPRRYRPLLLGYERTADGEPRWLTDEEISAAALAALDDDAAAEAVGHLDPWPPR